MRKLRTKDPQVGLALFVTTGGIVDRRASDFDMLDSTFKRLLAGEV